MELLRAHRLTAQYQLPAARAETERARLDRILREAAGDPLEQALASRGFGSSELVCVRRVDSQVSLRLSAPDVSLAEAWSASLAEAIDVAIERHDTDEPGGAANVVRYRSRAHALADLVEQALRGRFERAWAWQQLGLWPRAEVTGRRAAERYAVEALLSEPERTVPVLARLARKGLLPELVRWIEPWSWEAVARSAAAALGLGAGWYPRVGDRETASADPPRWAEALWRRSALLAAVAHTRVSQEVAEPLAVLAVLECEPALLHAPVLRDAVVKSLAAELASGPAAEVTGRAEGRAPDAHRTPATAAPREIDAPAADSRTAYQSDFGGVLFLLGPIADLGLPEEMFDPSGARTLRWTLHQLALCVVPARGDDPAVLAFAGLGPESEPPSFNEPPVSEEEEAGLLAWKERLIGELERRIPTWEESRSELPEFVCARRCRVLADPGWIELRFSLADVSTDIRRARLDLNPGYVPWLGVTVMFVYE